MWRLKPAPSQLLTRVRENVILNFLILMLTKVPFSPWFVNCFRHYGHTPVWLFVPIVRKYIEASF